MDLFDKASQVLESPDGVPIVYDLDSYFSKLEELVSKDRSFIRLPLDEPFFEIVDGGNNGRRIIKVPVDFQKNGISIQGDESAEIVWFSIDRYYDSFDLMGPSKADINNDANPKMPLYIMIQWETKNNRGVIPAFLDYDDRPFLGDDGKLYFGWAITSEMTQDPGNLKFNVRFFQFTGDTNPETGKPVLAFGLNTQTATVKVNPAINYDIVGQKEYNHEKELAIFESNGTIVPTIYGKNETILNRLQNSTKHNSKDEEESPLPMFVKNVQTSDRKVEILAKENAEAEDETANKQEFSYIDLNADGKLSIQALAIPSEGTGYISYAGRRMAQAGGTYYPIGFENTDDSYAATYKGVSEFTEDDIDETATIALSDLHSKRLEGFRYYMEEEGVMKPVTNLPAAGDPWRPEVDLDDEGNVKYSICLSNRYDLTKPGYYFISARNTEGRKITSAIASNRIYVPYPTGLVEDDVVGGGAQEKPQPTFIADGKAVLNIDVTEVEGDTVVYAWNHGDAILDGQEANSYEKTIEESEQALFDEIYSVSCYTARNNADTKDKNTIVRFFRVTDEPHKFIFNTTRPVDDTERMNGDIRERTVIGEDDQLPTIGVIFEPDNIVADDNTKFSHVVDAIKYRWILANTKEEGGDVDIFENDTPMTEEFNEIPVEANAIPEITFKPDEAGTYYCELINVVNGKDSEVVRTEYIYARKN